MSYKLKLVIEGVDEHDTEYVEWEHTLTTSDDVDELYKHVDFLVKRE